MWAWFKSTNESENVSDVEDEEINVSQDQKGTVSFHELFKCAAGKMVGNVQSSHEPLREVDLA